MLLPSVIKPILVCSMIAGSEGSTEHLATAQDAVVPRVRVEAARSLRSSLEAAAANLALDSLVGAARGAIDELGPGPFAASLEKSVFDARWWAVVDPQVAAQNLERDLRDVPTPAASLPEDFPAPTLARAIELKWFPSLRLARTEVRETDPQRARQSIFAHMERNELLPTAPVLTTFTKVDGAVRPTSMALPLPSRTSGQLGPAGEVEVFDAAPGLMLCLGGRGLLTPERLDEAHQLLLAQIEELDAWVVAGPLRSAVHSSLEAPASSSAFEVQLPVRPADQGPGAALVLDLGARDEVGLWSPVNDTVMGGVSSSRVTGSGVGTALFEGNLSLENNGGFASIRRRPAELSLRGVSTLRLTFRGDGKQYRLRLRTNDSMGGVNYEVAFPTEADVWRTQRFELDQFVANWRGRSVPGADALAFENVRSVGIQLADEQVGSFRLELGALSAE
jgi:NADH dehydrogenase [ubiquinone] 1 alpha subcomplex assembly factor 1